MEHFTDLAHLSKYVPPVEPLHPPQKSEVVPMKVLFKDEKLKTDTIDILSQLITDANLDGTPQVPIPVHVHYTRGFMSFYMCVLNHHIRLLLETS